jgi:hypothetical protein
MISLLCIIIFIFYSFIGEDVDHVWATYYVAGDVELVKKLIRRIPLGIQGRTLGATQLDQAQLLMQIFHHASLTLLNEGAPMELSTLCACGPLRTRLDGPYAGHL